MGSTVVFLGLIAAAVGQVRLGSFPNVIDPSAISVSGFSSGGAMSTQFHFINSGNLVGAGVFAGSPFLCGADFVLCLVTPSLINVTALTEQARELSATGSISDVENVRYSKVFIYHGQKDSSNGPANGLKISEMYENFGADVAKNFEIDAEHSMPTNFYGAECGSNALPTSYISNCSYEASFEVLNYLYGDLSRPSSYGWDSYPGELFEFNQTEFVDGPGNGGMGETGIIYIPSNCTQGSPRICKLHIVFHGCAMNTASIGDVFVKKTGYLEVGEVNNIILVFPQTASDAVNPGGCWDTWGFTSDAYATLEGRQNIALNRIIDRLIG